MILILQTREELLVISFFQICPDMQQVSTKYIS